MKMSVSAADTTFTDLEGKDCAEAVAVLASLGVIQGRSETEYAPDDSLTRAEMTTILVRLMGAEGSAVSGDVFTDVKFDHWAYSNIAIAYRAGLVAGMGEGTFAPDQNVTHAQLVKMLICALGYDVQAESQGGYPGGYYAKAAQLGMLNGVSAEMNQAATRGNMALILYNTIDVPLFEQTTYGAGAEGIVAANYYTVINVAERTCTVDEVAIGSRVYKIGKTDAADYLGMKVKAYYLGTATTDAEDPDLLIVEPGKAAVSYEFATAEISEETTSTELVYEEEGKEKTIAVDGNATLIVNGQVEERDILASDLKPEIGTVKLICNSGASADVVVVWSYTNYLVQSKNIKDELVYFKGVSDPMEIDPDDKTVKSQFITAEGEPFDINGVEKWNILSVARSTDNKVLKVVKSNASVTGKVTETDEDTAAIDGVEYPVAEDGETPVLNTTAKFYLDFTGSIVAIDTNIDSGYKYGYLAGAEYARGIDGIAQFKIFTEEGEMKVFSAAAKVTVNDTPSDATKVLDTFPKVVGYQNKVSMITIRQLIKYETNANGEINEIITASDATTNVSGAAGNAGFNKVLNLDVDGKAKYGDDMTGGVVHYIHNLGLLGANMAVNGATRIFQVPAADAADDEYKIIPAKDFPHRTNLPYVTAYDLSESYALGAIVRDMGAVGTSTGGVVKYWSDMNVPVGLITSVSKSVNSEMEPEYNITVVDWSGNTQKLKAKDSLLCGYFYANTDFKTDSIAKVATNANDNGIAANKMPVTTSIKPDQLRAGDMMRFEIAADGYLDVAALVYRAETPGMKDYSVKAGGEGKYVRTTAESIYGGGDMVSNGIVKFADADAIVTETNIIDYDPTTKDCKGNKDAKVTRVFPAPSKIFMFDRETGEAKAITIGEITVDDEYVALWRTITPMIFWIIR